MLTLTPKIKKGLIRVTKLHYEQKSKGTETPYIVHLFGVTLIVSKYSTDEDVIIAALLHDSLEDIKPEIFNADVLIHEFGQRVYEIVKGVSEEKDGNMTKEEKIKTWKDRKLKYFELLKNDAQESLLVACADTIYNLSSMIEDYQKLGEEYWRDFNIPENKLENSKWFYGEVYKILKDRLQSPIIEELEKDYNRLLKLS